MDEDIEVIEQKEEIEIIKIMFLHESGSGATSIINAIIGDKFNENIIATLIPSFIEYKINFENKKYIFELWDTNGRESFRNMTKVFIRDTKIVIFVYDISKKQSFIELEYWIKITKEILGNNFIGAIIGNKIDLLEELEVPEKKAYEFAELNKMNIKFVSCKEDPKSIKAFIKEIAYDYISPINDDFIKRKKKYYLTNINKNYIKNIIKYNIY